MIWLIILGAAFALGGLSQIFSNFGNGIVMIVIGSALLFWGLRKKILPNVFNSQKEPSGSSLTTEIFYLAGVCYYAQNIGKLAIRNPAWKYTVAKATSEGMVNKPIYRYNYVNKPVKLIPEPKNPNDKNAIAVYFAGELVGYIKMDDNKHILDILKNREVKYISGFIAGGDYKILTPDGQFLKDSESLQIRVKIAYK